MTVSILILKQTLFYVYERTKIPKVFKNRNTFIQKPIGKK